MIRLTSRRVVEDAVFIVNLGEVVSESVFMEQFLNPFLWEGSEGNGFILIDASGVFGFHLVCS